MATWLRKAWSWLLSQWTLVVYSSGLEHSGGARTLGSGGEDDESHVEGTWSLHVAFPQLLEIPPEGPHWPSSLPLSAEQFCGRGGPSRHLPIV